MPKQPMPIDLVENDYGRQVVYDLLLDGTGYELTVSSVIECHMTSTETGDVTVVTDCVEDPDQVTNPGRVTTTFAAAQLVAGRYTLEWEVTDGTAVTTFPGVGAQRPTMTVRPEAG